MVAANLIAAFALFAGQGHACRAPPIASADSMLIGALATGAAACHDLGQVQRQVRIERRVVIRIAPLGAASPLPLAPEGAAKEIDRPAARPRERDAARCLPLSDIAGVRIGGGGRLLLYMRDQRVISATLERACQVSSFYSGFYVESTEDGQLCVNRDQLHARSGADCTLATFRELVSEGD